MDGMHVNISTWCSMDEADRDFCPFVGIIPLSEAIHAHDEISGKTSDPRALHIEHLSAKRWRVLFYVMIECL